MSNANWEAIHPEYTAGLRSLRDIAGEFGVSEAAIRKHAKKNGWVRNGSQNTKSTQVRKDASANQKGKVRTKNKSSTGGKSKSASGVNSEGAKPATTEKKPRGKPNFPPFQKGNTYAVKHSAYARRMLLSDDVIEEASGITLADELFRIRAANLMASDAIGRYKAELEDENPDKERRTTLEANIRAAEHGIARNTTAMISIEYTLANIAKMGIDAQYRIHATEKVIAEIEAMGSGGNGAIIIHNALPVPGLPE